MTASSAIPDLLSQLVPNDGVVETGLDGVQLFRMSESVPRTASVYPPSLCVIASGEKRAYLEGYTHTYNAGTYLCSTLPLPIEAEIPHASEEEPVTGLLISLETRTFTELLLEVRSATPEPASGDDVAAGMTVTTWDDAFEETLRTLLTGLPDKAATDVLGRGRLREVFYAVLMGPAGAVIRRHIGRGIQDMSSILTYIGKNLGQPVDVDDLAGRAGMSRAAFDRHFKAATTMSPLRYVKAVKLNEAAVKMTAGMDVSAAASDVGYVSASQFSREFKRHFGLTPREWAKNRAGESPSRSAAMV